MKIFPSDGIEREDVLGNTEESRSSSLSGNCQGHKLLGLKRAIQTRDNVSPP